MKASSNLAYSLRTSMNFRMRAHRREVITPRAMDPTLMAQNQTRKGEEGRTLNLLGSWGQTWKAPPRKNNVWIEMNWRGRKWKGDHLHRNIVIILSSMDTAIGRFLNPSCPYMVLITVTLSFHSMWSHSHSIPKLSVHLPMATAIVAIENSLSMNDS